MNEVAEALRAFAAGLTHLANALEGGEAHPTVQVAPEVDDTPAADTAAMIARDAYNRDIIYEKIPSGKFAGKPWGLHLMTKRGREWADYLVKNARLDPLKGPNPNDWHYKDMARVAAWILAHGELGE